MNSARPWHDGHADGSDGTALDGHHGPGDTGCPGHCGCQQPWPVEHWALMFAAVADRLRRAVAAPRRPMPEMCGIVLECVEALEMLQAALAVERAAHAQAQRLDGDGHDGLGPAGRNPPRPSASAP